MKFSSFLLALLFAGYTAAHAQKISPAQVPAAVKATLAARFPTVKTATWSKETQQVPPTYDYETHNDFGARNAFSTQDVYEADFKLNGRKTSVLITAAGLVQETEITLNDKQLPPAVRAVLASSFSTSQVQEVAAITKADGSTLYEAEIAQASGKQDVFSTADGKPALR